MRIITLLFILTASLICAAPAGAQTADGTSNRTFAHSPTEVYEAAVALAIDRGYAERGLVQGTVFPVSLDLHQTLTIGGEHVDLYVRRENGHARLLLQPLRPEISPSARHQLTAYLNDLSTRLNQSNG